MANISALNETSLSELSPALERGDISSREIVEQCLAAIQARDPKLHAFVKLDAESALALADAADQQRRQGYARGPLHGLPVVLKDLIEVDGEVTTLPHSVQSTLKIVVAHITVQHLSDYSQLA